MQQLLELIGRDEKMLLVLESIRTAAKTDISVLILGPTGVGKEGAARAIHDLSRRQARAFQAVSCAALPDSLFEAEVFGHEKGAFTGAHERRLGRVELANRGTLFLDEIGDLPLVSQAKLLRVLEERQVERLGGQTGIDVDFRLVSVTNRPLELLVSDGRFRDDLLLSDQRLHDPPAGAEGAAGRCPAARADVPVQAVRGRGAAARRAPVQQRDAPAAADHTWPGNIRELDRDGLPRLALDARARSSTSSTSTSWR